MVNAGGRGCCWTARRERQGRQAAEEPAEGGDWGHLCRAQLVPVSPACPSQGQLSCPVYTGTDLPCTPWNVWLRPARHQPALPKAQVPGREEQERHLGDRGQNAHVYFLEQRLKDASFFHFILRRTKVVIKTSTLLSRY